ncbi:MAG: hypothetical protein JNL83_01500 [Myxococcales bacterium]|nr:hypothetical protein [Myxococcales bacterium]
MFAITPSRVVSIPRDPFRSRFDRHDLSRALTHLAVSVRDAREHEPGGRVRASGIDGVIAHGIPIYEALEPVDMRESAEI